MLSVNGQRVRARRAGGTDARGGAARGPRPDRDEDRVRRGPLRRVHGPARRRAGALVHHARAHGRRPRGDDDRGPARPPARGGLRARGRAAVRVLHAGADRLGGGARRGEPRRRPARRSGTAWPGTSAAAGRIRTSRRRLRRGATDPDGEGGRGPVRGGLDGRRGGRARPVAGGPARGRRPAGAAPGRASSAPAARRVTRPTSCCRGCSTRPSCAARTPRRACARSTSRPRWRCRACATRSRSGDFDVFTDEPHYPGEAVAAVAADTAEQARRAVEAIAVEWEVAEPLLDPDEAVRRAHLTTETSRYARGDVEAGFAEADVVVEAEFRTASVLHNSMETHQAVCELAGRHAACLHLDPVHLGRPRRGREALRAPAGPRARRLRVHGRRLRLEERPGRLHADRSRARAPHRAAGPLRAHAARGEPGGREPQRDDPAAARRRARRRDARRARRRLHRTRSAGAAGCRARTARCRCSTRCENVATTLARGEAELGADGGVPRARASSRERSGSSACSTSSPPSSTSTRSSSAAGTTPTPTCSTPGRSPPSTCSSATACAEKHWARRRRGPRALGGAVEARRRAREPDLVRRRRAALVRVGARRRRRPRDGRHRDAGHRHGLAHGDGADRGRGARPAARPRPRRARRLRARPVRDALGRLVHDPVGRARRSRAAAADARDRSSSSPRSAGTGRSATLSLKGGRIVCSDGGSWPCRGPARPARETLRSSAPARAGRTRPGCACSRSASRSRRSRSTSRPARCGSSGSPRSTTSAGSSTRSDARSQVEGGIIQAVGHALSEQRMLDPATGTVLTQTLDAYKLPTIADVPEIVVRVRRPARRPPDEPRLEGTRRAADHPDRSRDRQRDPRRDRRRRALAADHARGDAAGARGGCEHGRRSGLQLLRPESVEEASAALRTARVRARRRHGPRSAPARRNRESRHACRSLRSARLVTSAASRVHRRPHDRRGHDARRARGRARRSRTRCARPAGSPPRRSCARWARSAATSCRRRAAGTGG